MYARDVAERCGMACAGLIAVALLASGCLGFDAGAAADDQPNATAAAARRLEAQIGRADPPLLPPNGAVSQVRCGVRFMHGGPGGPYLECHADVTVDGLTTKDVEMQFNLSRDYELRSPVCGAGTQRPNPFCRGDA